MSQTNECEMCNKTFTSLRGLQIHKAKCRNEKFYCELCDKTYVQKVKLKEHYETQLHKDAVKIRDLTTLVEELKFKLDETTIITNKIEEEVRYKEKEFKSKEYDLKLSIDAKDQTIKLLKDEVEYFKQTSSDLECDLRSLRGSHDVYKEYFEKTQKEILQIASQPKNNNNITNNYQNNSSTKIGNINAINTKLPLNDEFFEKLRKNFDVKYVFVNEQDVCRYTLSQGLNDYVLLLDKSRRILGFCDSEGNQVRDHDGIKLAHKIYEELTPCFENVSEYLKEVKENPNEIFVPTTLDRRKKLASLVKSKNGFSLQNFGKTIFNEYSKFDKLENKTSNSSLTDESKGVVDEADDNNDEKEEKYTKPAPSKGIKIKEIKDILKNYKIERLKRSIKSAFEESNYQAVIHGLEAIGAFLEQSANVIKIKNKGGSDKIEWFEILDDHNKILRLDVDSFFELLQQSFSFNDVYNIYTKLGQQYKDQADQFINIIINKQYDEDTEDIKQRIFDYTVGIF